MTKTRGQESQKYISVFIPTYNGQKYIAEVIDAILRQQLPSDYKMELLVIDSGSTDETLNILHRFADKLKLVEIPNSEFSHGGTRAKAAHITHGEFILFLSQDATPANDRWVINLIEPFFLSEKIGCVFGRQIPRPNAVVTIKREVASVFAGLGSPDTIAIHRHKSLVDNKVATNLNAFFSDVNSAVRRNLLIDTVPFRNVNYAEDQALAEDMLKIGYLKAYAPLGAVLHSNEYSARQYFHRKFDEYIGLHDSTGYTLIASKKSLLLGWIRPTLFDWKFIRNDAEYSKRSKIVWYLESPFYNFASKAGLYFAAKNAGKQFNPNLSLEKRNKINN